MGKVVFFCYSSSFDLSGLKLFCLCQRPVLYMLVHVWLTGRRFDASRPPEIGSSVRSSRHHAIERVSERAPPMEHERRSRFVLD